MGQEARRVSTKITEEEIDAYEPEAWRTSLARKLELGKAVRPEYDPVWLDIRSRTLQVRGRDSALVLSDFEYQILWLLVRARRTTNAPVSRQEMIEFLYENFPEAHVEELVNVENVLSAEISMLRGKMDGFTKEAFIQTDHGYGYRLGTLQDGETPTAKGQRKGHVKRKIIKMRGWD